MGGPVAGFRCNPFLLAVERQFTSQSLSNLSLPADEDLIQVLRPEHFGGSGGETLAAAGHYAALGVVMGPGR